MQSLYLLWKQQPKLREYILRKSLAQSSRGIDWCIAVSFSSDLVEFWISPSDVSLGVHWNINAM